MKLSIINFDLVTSPFLEDEKSILPPSKPFINLYFLTKGLALSDEKFVVTELSSFVFILKKIFSLSEKLDLKFALKILLFLISRVPLRSSILLSLSKRAKLIFIFIF